MADPTPGAHVRFAGFDLDRRSGELWKAGVRVPLPEQPLRLLEVLLEQPGEVVSREHLRTRLWPADTFVDFEHGLNAAVKRLRDALGDSAEHPRFVETVPKRGYRLIAPLDVELPPDIPVNKPLLKRVAMLIGLVGLAAIGVALIAAWRHASDSRGGSTSPADTSSSQLTLVRITVEAGLQTQPTWSPDGRLIAFASDRNGNLDIWVQPASGGAAVPITHDPADDSAPAWSPTGELLAFRSEREGGGIYVVNPLGGNERRLASFGHRPRWSPDGTRLLITSGTGQQWEWSAKHAYVVTLAGSPPMEILRSFFQGVVKSPSVMWHPDGERVSIWGEHRTLGPGFWTARLPDGEPVLSSGSVEPLKQSYGFWWFVDAVWASTGDALYFTSPGPHSPSLLNLWRAAIEPSTLRWIGEPEQLTNGPGPDAAADPSRDGSRLAFASHRKESRLWSFKLDATGHIRDRGEPLTAPGVTVLLFDIDRDGRKLLLVQDRARGNKEPPEISERDLATGAERILSRTVGPWQALPQHPRWTSDSNHVAYVRWCDRDAEGRPVGDCHPKMILLDARSGEDREVANAPGDVVRNIWDFSPDGRWMAVDSRRSEADPTSLVLYPTAPDESHRVRRIGAPPGGLNASQARFSPSGRWIAVGASPDPASSSAVFVVDAAGGDFVRVTDGRAFDQKPRWSSDGRILYFLSSRGSSANITNVWAIGFDPERGTPVGAPFPVTTYAVSSRSLPAVQFADIRIAGDRLIVPIEETSGSIWMLERRH